MPAAATLSLERPTSVDEVARLLADPGVDSRVMAGGQSLTPLLTLGLAVPELIVSIDRCEELKQFTQTSSGSGDPVAIGAGVTTRTIERSEGIQRSHPLLVDAIGRIGSVHVRNFGTVVGNVCHADPGGDLIPTLLCFGAELELRNQQGTRRVALADFATGPFSTVLEDDEVAVACTVEQLDGNWNHAYRKFVHRSGDLAVATCAVLLQMNGTEISDVRVSVGAAVSRAVRLSPLESLLVGLDVGDLVGLLEADPLGDAAELLMPDATHSLDYLQTMLPRLIVAAVSEATGSGQAKIGVSDQ